MVKRKLNFMIRTNANIYSRFSINEHCAPGQKPNIIGRHRQVSIVTSAAVAIAIATIFTAAAYSPFAAQHVPLRYTVEVNNILAMVVCKGIS